MKFGIKLYKDEIILVYQKCSHNMVQKIQDIKVTEAAGVSRYSLRCTSGKLML